MMESLRKTAKSNRWIMIFPRIFRAFKNYNFFIPLSKKIIKYGFTSKEITSFTYNLTSFNEIYLIHLIALASKETPHIIKKYFEEIKNDDDLKQYIVEKIKQSPYKNFKDLRCDFGSRIAWYALIRAQKSKIVVENGVELGYSGVLMCRALQKNIEEGFPGKYIGIDINPEAGFFLKDSQFDNIAYFIIDDAVVALNNFNKKIDFYFSDGARNQEYENREFLALKSHLSLTGIIASNKMIFSSELALFSEKSNRSFVYFKEEPQHWYSGSGLGISFTK